MLFFSLVTILSFGAVLYKRPDLGLALLVLLLPTYLVRFSFHGFPTTLLEFLILLYCARTLWLQRKQLRSHLRSLPHPTILLIIPISALAVIVSPNIFAALGLWKAYILEPLLVYIVSIPLLKLPGARQMITRSFAFLLIYTSLFAYIQRLFPEWIPIPWDIEGRVTSVFPYPNAFGLLAGPLIVFGCMLLLTKKEERIKTKDIILWLTAILLGCGAIVLAKSEAAIAAIVMLLAGVGLSQKTTRIPTGGILILISCIVLLVPSLRQPLRQKIFFKDPSEQVRLIQWKETTALLQDHPFFGAGLAGYPTKLIPYHTHTYIEIFQDPHNIILNIYVELGILGVVWFVCISILYGKEFLERKPYRHEPVLFATYIALFHMILHGLVDVPFFKNDLALLTAILLALIASYTYVDPRAALSQNSHAQN